MNFSVILRLFVTLQQLAKQLRLLNKETVTGEKLVEEVLNISKMLPKFMCYLWLKVQIKKYF